MFFRVENYFHLMYNMFLKSMFKDFSNDVLIAEVMFKTKFDSPCMLFTNSTKVYVMRVGVQQEKFSTYV